MSLSYCFSIPGIFKILTLILGTIAFGFGIYSYNELIIQEEFFIRTLQASLIMSTIFLVLFLTIPEKFISTDISGAIDVGFHLTVSISLLVAGSLIIYSAVDIERTHCHILHVYPSQHFCQFYLSKLIAGILGLFDGLLYIVTAATIFLTHQELHYKKTREKVIQKSRKTQIHSRLPEVVSYNSNDIGFNFNNQQYQQQIHKNISTRQNFANPLAKM